MALKKLFQFKFHQAHKLNFMNNQFANSDNYEKIMIR